RREKLGIGHAVPKGVGESACGGVRPPLWFRRVVEAEKKIGRLQHDFSHKLRAREEFLLLLKDALVALHFSGVERTAECLQTELFDELRAALGRRRTCHQVRCAVAEGASCKLLRRRAVGILEQRRKILSGVLILESVDEILRRKLGGREAPIAQ